MESQARILNVTTECNNQKRKKIDDKQSFVNAQFVSLFNGIEFKIKGVDKITKHLDIPRCTMQVIQ